MKKLLGIVVLGLLLGGNAFAKIDWKKRDLCESSKYKKLCSTILDKNFPMIKCNINKRGKKLFFFPFDKFYDKVHIDIKNGEFYTNSIKECIRKGFKHVG